MKLCLKILLLIFCVADLKSQSYPSDFSFNGCYYLYNGYKAPDSIPCKKPVYKLVFEDNFDSTKLNTAKWQQYYPWGHSLHSSTSGTGWERQFYSDSNVFLKNGYLYLHTEVDPAYRPPEATPDLVFFKYTSGMIYSKVDFTSGKFEIRCKIPPIEGLFPAYWLYGKCAQEIDIFEFSNDKENSDRVTDSRNDFMTYHKNFDCNKKDGANCGYNVIRDMKSDMSEDFHIYTMDWDNYKMVWSVDGKIVREVYRYWTISAPYPDGPLFGYSLPVKSCYDLQSGGLYTAFEPFPTSDIRMNLIINTAVAYDRAGSSGILPQDLLVDYVRVYERVESSISYGENGTGLNIFPNPNNGTFSFSELIYGQPIYEINVLNLYGISVPFTETRTNNQITIKLLTQQTGIYYLRVRSGGTYYTAKIVYN